jgi:hypothetical protein
MMMIAGQDRSRRRPVSAPCSIATLNPIKAVFGSAVINGVAAVPTMVMIIGSRRQAR